MLERAVEMFSDVNQYANGLLEGYSPTTYIAGTVATYLLLNQTYHYSQKAKYVWQHLPASFFNKKLVMKSAAELLHDKPFIGPIITKELNKEFEKLSTGLQKDLDKLRSSLSPVVTHIPQKGRSKDDILNQVKAELEAQNRQAAQGHLSGAVYTPEPESQADHDYITLLLEMFRMTRNTNPLHDDDFPSVDRMTAEVLAMCQTLFHGDIKRFNNPENKALPGLITNGGTSSIIEACRAYVRYAREVKGIEKPVIIVPKSAHVSFQNAALTLNATLIEVDVDPVTQKADVAAMEKAITKDTCLIVGSAPSFPCGVFDPIEDLARMAKKHNIPLHVDACLGGFLFPFSDRPNIPCYDFSIEGVTSISADTHKYGMLPKGNSVLLFSPDNPASSYAVFTSLHWMGGMYVALGTQGTRPGWRDALVWAALQYFGMEDYQHAAENILNFTQQLAEAIAKVDGIELICKPEMSVIAVTTTPESDIDPYLLTSLLKKKHWGLHTIQNPAGFHFCITSVHVAHQETILREFIKDLTEAVEYAKQHPHEKPKGNAGVYGMLPEIPDLMEHRFGARYAALHAALSPENLKHQLEEKLEVTPPSNKRRKVG